MPDSKQMFGKSSGDTPDFSLYCDARPAWLFYPFLREFDLVKETILCALQITNKIFVTFEKNNNTINFVDSEIMY